MASSTLQSGGTSPFLDEARHRIRELFQEIAALCRSESDLSPKDFYSEFLTRVVQSLAALGGAVWTNGPAGLELVYQINLRSTGLLAPGRYEDLVRHNGLLQRVAERGAAQLLEPYSGSDDPSIAGNPTPHALLVCPLKLHGGVRALAEIFVRADTPPASRRTLLEYLQQTCELAGDYFKGQELRQFVDRQALWQQLERFTQTVHASLDLNDTLYAIVHEGRALIGCDRVSLAVRRGDHLQIEAISGIDTFDRRANAIKALGTLATVVAAGKEPLWYTGDAETLEPQVEHALEAYAVHAHAKALAVLPLVHVQGEGPSAEILGALVIEEFGASQFRPGVPQRVEAIVRHAAIALGNALDCRGLFVWPLVLTLSWQRRLAALPHAKRVLVIAASLLVGLVLLMLVPAPFRLSARGSLEPATRNVFASVDGEVEEVFVEHGQHVRAGQPLLRLRNDALETERLKLASELASVREQIDSYRRLRAESERKSADQTEVVSQLQRLEIEEQYLQRALSLRARDRDRLLVCSPLDGEVVTWNVRQLLEHRPVSRGQRLLAIGDPQGHWELDLRMLESRIGKLEATRRRLGGELRVEYVLATDPASTYSGRLRDIHRAAEIDGEEGTIVRLRVALDPKDLPRHLRPRASVTAKIDCGWRPLGYVWFHEVVAFMQRLTFRV